MSELRFEGGVNPACVRPLDAVEVSGPGGGTLVVRDGCGDEYVRTESPDGRATFLAGRAAGVQRLTWLDGEGESVAEATLRLAPETRIADAAGRYERLHQVLVDTMFMWHAGWGEFVRIEGRLYKFYVSWLRDHVHVLKGMRYYDCARDLLHSGIDLYAEWQREDGMIWDKVKRMHHSELQNWRDHEFARGDFIRKVPGNPTRRFQRIPVENDVEFLFLEGLYRTWQATGDDRWMASRLDQAIAAVRYATTDRYRWSEKYGLLKRGFTIDSWDFVHDDDMAVSGTRMTVDPDRTAFGVMHGDNTGMMASCRYLARMLRHVGRGAEAGEFDELADTLKRRLDEVSWNGRFYRHHVTEAPSFVRDVGGTDEGEQVSLSNSYALNRGIDFEQARAILATYRRIREEMPDSSPGEFYNLYPPFEKGFRFMWDYMNGGVSTICAGELARGAFDHGEEGYGREILDWALEQGERYGGFLPCCYRGRLPAEPERSFRPLELCDEANVDFRWEGPEEGIGWLGEEDNDLAGMPTGRQRLEGVDFDVIDPSENAGRAAVGLSTREPYKPAATIPVGGKAGSVYFLHALSRPSSPAGRVTLRYADGTHQTVYVRAGSEADGWFMPAPNSARLDYASGRPPQSRPDNLRVAWQGANRKFENVGVFAWGMRNPHPDREIDRIELEACEGPSVWMILGVTLSDADVFFPALPINHGIPDNWGAAAVVDALLCGLAGVVDDDRGMRATTVSPRWSAAGEDEAAVCVSYPSGGGYVCYDYRCDPAAGRMDLTLTASGDACRLRLLLPDEAGEALTARLAGREVPVELTHTADSRYAEVALEDLRPGTLTVTWR